MLSLSVTHPFRNNATKVWFGKPNSTDVQLARDASIRHGWIEVVAQAGAFEGPVSIVDVSGVKLELREVSGLVDLNTASRPLLEMFFDSTGYSSDQLQTYLDWRADGRRLLRLEDFNRVVGAQAGLVDLYRLATLYSGKQGLAPEAVTEELLNVMGWDASGIPEPFTAPLGGAVYQIHEMPSTGGAERYLGTISRNQNEVSVLELR